MMGEQVLYSIPEGSIYLLASPPALLSPFTFAKDHKMDNKLWMPGTDFSILPFSKNFVNNNLFLKRSK
jgi:hypothetical protein